jgi:transposase-like protein
MKWKDLGGEERYRIVEMVRKGEMTIKEICEAFGVTRQALRQAVEKADQASVEALEPRKRGRKPRKLEEQEASELMREKSSLEKEVDHWKQKYEVARTFIELERKLERSEQLPGKETARKKTKNQLKKDRQRVRARKTGKR